MPLPLTVSCFSEIQIGFYFLVLAHPGSPGIRAIKRVCVRVELWCYFNIPRLDSLLRLPIFGKMGKLPQFLPKMRQCCHLECCRNWTAHQFENVKTVFRKRDNRHTFRWKLCTSCSTPFWGSVADSYKFHLRQSLLLCYHFPNGAAGRIPRGVIYWWLVLRIECPSKWCLYKANGYSKLSFDYDFELQESYNVYDVGLKWQLRRYWYNVWLSPRKQGLWNHRRTFVCLFVCYHDN